MPLRPPAGFISANFDPLKNPDAPTGVSASAGDASASVSFTAPANVGGSAITAYYAVSNPSQVTVSGTSSPVTVTGLSNGTAYTFQVWALNSFGPGPFSAASGSVTPSSPRALYFAGFLANSSLIANIDYVTIATTGNAANFGSLMAATRLNAATGSSSRGLQARGLTSDRNVIEYVTYASTGNSQDFGDLTVGRYALTACNSATRSVFAGGDASDLNIIDYVTTATIGNATDFGDLTLRTSNLAACSSPTRGIFAGGSAFPGNGTNVISYIETASTGNSIDFGDLIGSIYNIGGCSSSTRGIFMGGETTSNVIQYITIASTGNATDFGDCSFGGPYKSAASSQTRGLIFGGNEGTNVPADARATIEYVTIASTGNTTNFGDLTQAKEQGAASSAANGGVQ
jgi:hypothetical protein